MFRRIALWCYRRWFAESIRNDVLAYLIREPRIWGDPSRVHIAASAIINDALFNVNSGEVFIHDHVLFGHSVSVLTGTHDYTKFDRERQSFPTAGRDVVICRGVWIASSAIIIGPCVIGEHAVIGAGSVVCENVPAYAVVAGNPAILVRRIMPPDGMPHVDHEDSTAHGRER